MVAMYEKLLNLARRQGEALRRGDVEACAELMAERDRLVHTLQSDASDYSAEERAGLGPLIREILAIDGNNAILLQLLIEETSRAIVHLSAGQEGTAAYFRAMGCTGPARGTLNHIG